RWSGEHSSVEALALLEAGADLIDIGGESTRPGATPVSDDAEIARVVPVIASLRARTGAPISIDTMKPSVAKAAAAAGATIWNDVRALGAPGAVEAAASLGLPVILMHMRGEPRTMQQAPHYDDVVTEVAAFLAARAHAAKAAGVADIWVDPGLGFGKTLAHNLALLAGLSRLKAETGCPVLIGASRKSMIEKIEGAPSRPEERIGGSLALALRAAENGADMLRVHDVRETVQTLKVWRAAAGAMR
ncbi:MAG: dihydropteroate synthase, partial [Hyphomonadaceae bacterium]